VPNNEEIHTVTAQDLAGRLRGGLRMICEKATARGVKVKVEEIATRSLVAPACGLGSTTVEIADEVFEKLKLTGDILKRG